MGPSSTRLHAAALLVAAGRGTRFGSDEPKQFALLAGRPLYEHAARAMTAAPEIEALVVVAPPGWEARVRAALESTGLAGRLRGVVAGGPTRQESVRHGLATLGGCTHVVVHDAARPFVTPRLVRTALEAAREHGAATVALPVSDTLMRVRRTVTAPAAGVLAAGGTEAEAVVDRDGVWSVQTPQAFEIELLRRAHRHALERGLEATDDCGLVLALGRHVELVPGSWWNIKVTRPADLARAEALWREREVWCAEEAS